MRLLATILILFPFLGFSQSNCRNFNVLDSENNQQAAITCNYPFNEEGCISLHAQYTDFKSTEDYQIESVSYNPYGSFSEGTVITIADDDKFSQAIDLPFSFCYFGNTFDQIVVGDNGLVSFDTSLAGADSPFYSSFIPNPALYNNTIYGLFHDITNDNDVFGCTDNPNTAQNECGEIRYNVIGSEPCRQFVINFNHINHFNDEISHSTFQIVLFEATQAIEIHILEKPINNETTITGQYRKNATIGIQNENGTIAYSPAGRNNETFETNNEAWKFVPNGSSIVNVKWYNAQNELIGTGDSISVCTDVDAEVYAEATYNFCNGNVQTDTDNFSITFSPSYPRVENQLFQVCDAGDDGSEVINLLDYAGQMVNNNYSIEIYNTEQDAVAGINMVTNIESYSLTADHVFWVKLLNGPDCFDIGKMSLEFLNPPSLQQNQINICDINNDLTELIDLDQYRDLLIGSGSSANISFYNTEADANAMNNAFSTMSVTGNTTIYARVDINNQCIYVDAVQINLVNAPEIDSDIYIDLCDNQRRVNLTDFIPAEVLAQYNSIFFYRTFENAVNNVSRLTGINNYNITGISTLYMRVNSGADCYSIAQIHFSYLAALEVQEDIRVQCDSDINEIEIFDLSLSIPDMADVDNNTAISYFTTYEGALNNSAALQISNPNAYELPIGRHYVYVRFENMQTGCISIERIVLHAVNIPEAMKTEFEFCDANMDEEELVQLHDMDLPLKGEQLFIETYYYGTLEDAQSNSNELFEIVVAPTAIVYVKMVVVFEGEELCSDIFELNLSLILTQGDPVLHYADICDNHNNGSEQVDLTMFSMWAYENAGITDWQFFTMDGVPVPNPTNFHMTGNTTIEIRQRDNLTCIAPVHLIFNFMEAVEAEDILTFFCDELPFNYEIINIEELIFQENPGLNDVSIEVYTSLNGATAQNQNQRIADIQNYELIHSVVILYARIDDGVNCPSIIQVALKLTEAPQAIHAQIPVCDSDDDNTETFQLSYYNSYIFGTNSYNVSYFPTEDDAANHTNQITELTISDAPITVYYNTVHTGVVTCSATGQIEFFLASRANTSNVMVTICDNSNDGVEQYDLRQHEDEIGGASADYTFKYYRTEQNAIYQTQRINNPGNAQISIDNPTIWVRVENEFGCYNLAQIQFDFAQAPEVQDIAIGSCDDDFNLTESFDLTSHLPEIITDASGINVSYYKNYQAAVSEDENYVIANPENYTVYNQLESVFVRVVNNTTYCYSIASIEIEIYQIPKLIDARIIVCDGNFDGQYEIYLPEIDSQIIEEVGIYEFVYFNNYDDAVAEINPLNPNEVYVLPSLDSGLYVKVTNANGCSAISFATFQEGEISDNLIPDGAMLELCDDDFDGMNYFNLNDINNYIESNSNYTLDFYTTIEDAQAQSNPIANIDSYQNVSPTQIIYVRISEEGKCSFISHFAIRVNQLPANPFEELYEKCPGSSITLDAGKAVSYLWNTGETTRFIEVITPGNYSVEITNDFGCSANYSTAVSDYPLHSVSYTFTTQNNVVFSVIGDSDYEFSLDNETWQASNVFLNLKQGTYMIFVKDINTGCVIKLPFLVFDWYNIITPNGDGMNDDWVECGLEVFGTEKSHLTIFDRYGKSIFEESSNTCFQWDGKYQGRALPTDTYWFKVSLPDGREFTGYITIKNY